MDTFKSRVAKLEALQQVTQLEVTESVRSRPRGCLGRWARPPLTLATVLRVLVSSACACPVPLLSSRLRTGAALLLVGLGALAWRRSSVPSPPQTGRPGSPPDGDCVPGIPSLYQRGLIKTPKKNKSRNLFFQSREHYNHQGQKLPSPHHYLLLRPESKRETLVGPLGGQAPLGPLGGPGQGQLPGPAWGLAPAFVQY